MIKLSIKLIKNLVIVIKRNFGVIFITSLFWIILCIFFIIKPFDFDSSYKEFIAETNDSIKVPLIVTTNSKYSTEELTKKISSYSHNSIKEMLLNENDVLLMFKCSEFTANEYTIEDAKSFDDNRKYTPSFPELSIYDKQLVSKWFIDDKNLNEEFIDYVKKLTENGKSRNQASSIYNLEVEYGRNHN